MTLGKSEDSSENGLGLGSLSGDKGLSKSKPDFGSAGSEKPDPCTVLLKNYKSEKNTDKTERNICIANE